jgi:hypothetical protein
LNESILETEKLVHALSDELLKLKSAVDRYDENREGLNAIREILASIGTASSNLAENSKQFLEELDKIGFETRLGQIQDASAKLVQSQARQVDSVNSVQEDLNQHIRTTEKNHSDQLRRLKDQEDRIQRASLEQASRMKLTQGLVFVLLLLEALTLVTIFVK